ncbi:MAG: LVIVD repeat-containing protein [Gammaproteobacteria bacterium]
MKGHDRYLSRRTLIKGGAIVLGSAAFGRPAFANHHPHPHEGSLDYLDPHTYISRCRIHAHLEDHVGMGGKMQMMASGTRRYLLNRGKVWDVSDALHPELVKENAFIGNQLQLAFHSKIKKWVLMTGASPPPTSSTEQAPNGKYDDPRLIDNSRYYAGLRGVRIYDASNPADFKLLSMWSCDQGDPGRAVQTGGGTHRNYYDGGRYAYLDAAPDNSFINMESPVRLYSNCLQIIDVADPSTPRFVSNWWFPGQRGGELRAYRQWREYGDRSSFTSLHGAFYVPRRVEDGGRYGYCSYGSFGITVHDISDPGHPKLVSRWRPPYLPGAIPFHTADISWLDRGILIGSSETLNPDCNEPFHDNYVLDIHDIRNMKPIARFGRWQPPEGAPWKDFCDKRGRYGTHNPPHLKAPGRRHPSFMGYAAFNAGFQFMDFSDPANPKMDGYFIPPSGGNLAKIGTYHRIGDNLFVEWDRKLMWLSSDSGIYLASHPSLGAPDFKPRKVTEWTLDGLNQGHDG